MHRIFSRSHPAAAHARANSYKITRIQLSSPPFPYVDAFGQPRDELAVGGRLQISQDL
jgi:hypothetical protein